MDVPSELPLLLNDYDMEKLPPGQRLLLDPTQPLPPGAQFFPETHRWTSILLALSGAGVLFLCGLASLGGAILTIGDSGGRPGTSTFGCFGVAMLICFGAGIVCLLNARNRARAIRAQTRGEAVRIGLFLSPDGLLERGPFSYRFVPRGRIRAIRLEGTAPMLSYLNDEGKELSLTLPRHLVGMTPEQTVRAVEGWWRQGAA